MSNLPDNDNGRDEPMVFIVIGKAYETDNSEGIDIHVILRAPDDDTAVPDISIEVDNFDEIHARILKAELPIEYGPANESWGVRRLFLRDPFGRLVNILSHL